MQPLRQALDFQFHLVSEALMKRLKQATNFTSLAVERVGEQTQPAYRTLMTQLRNSQDLFSALTGQTITIASLLQCDGALMILDGQSASLGIANDSLTESLAEDLQHQIEQGMYFTNQWRHAKAGQGAPHAVLAVRFNTEACGWIAWFRRNTTGRGHTQPWRERDIYLAEQLRTDLLDHCLARATQQSRVQHRLITQFTHSLCNPLQSISMSASLLQAENERNTNLQRNIISSSAKMEKMIDQVREANRLGAGEAIGLSLRDTNVSSIVEQALAGMRKLHLQTIFKSDIARHAHAVIDPEQYAKGLGILLTNAVQHRTSDTPVSISLHRVGSDLCLDIRNQAPSLSADQLTGLFEPASATRAPGSSNGGLGIGLYIASAIAQAHQGSLNVHQDVDGIVFSFRIPSSPNSDS
ncbi:hypothetical protein LCGC14_0064600 [marine sediment metagenome]